MRSLAFKLTLAFLGIGVLGVTIFALLVGARTRNEFDRFLSGRDQTVLIEALSNYRGSRTSWAGVGTMLRNTPPLDFYSRDIVILDETRTVVLGNRVVPIGQRLGSDGAGGLQTLAIPVPGSSAENLGYILLLPRDEGPEPPPGRPQTDQAFIDRIGVAALTSAAITALLALAVGWLLARTLTRSLTELTHATHAMAGGALNQQVNVRTRDEVGLLAASFNKMSTDLARASHLRRQMTADLAHDLRTPLSILRGYTEGLQQKKITATPAIYEVMNGEVQHLSRMVEDLRILSLADAGELTLNKRKVDPKALLERTALAQLFAAEQHGLSLEVNAPETLPSILVDTDRINQVLGNLVTNALAHTTHGGIVLSARADADAVSLVVQDTGSGIAPDQVPFLFDRFYRGDAARQRGDNTSSGLGLAIVKALVEAHGGTIGVTSELQHGTTFTIRFPQGGVGARP